MYIGSIMLLVAGIVARLLPAGKINGVYGYRTRRSEKMRKLGNMLRN